MFGEMLSLLNMQNPANWIQPGLCHYLIIALIVFLTGLTITISSGNLIKIIIGFEFMINAVCLNFAAANAFINENNAPLNIIQTVQSNTIVENFAPVKNTLFNFTIPEGQTISLIIIAIGAMSTAAGLGLILAIYFRFKTINTTGLNSLKSADCPDYDDLKTEDDI